MKPNPKNLAATPARGREYLRTGGKRFMTPVHGDVAPHPLPGESVIHKMPHSKTHIPPSTEEEYEDSVGELTSTQRRWRRAVFVVALAVGFVSLALATWIILSIL